MYEDWPVVLDGRARRHGCSGALPRPLSLGLQEAAEAPAWCRAWMRGHASAMSGGAAGGVFQYLCSVLGSPGPWIAALASFELYAMHSIRRPFSAAHLEDSCGATAEAVATLEEEGVGAGTGAPLSTPVEARAVLRARAAQGRWARRWAFGSAGGHAPRGPPPTSSLADAQAGSPGSSSSSAISRAAYRRRAVRQGHDPSRAPEGSGGLPGGPARGRRAAARGLRHRQLGVRGLRRRPAAEGPGAVAVRVVRGSGAGLLSLRRPPRGAARRGGGRRAGQRRPVQGSVRPAAGALSKP
ncbi:unnamed protein product, partial [Prorocentrum cordatum]